MAAPLWPEGVPTDLTATLLKRAKALRPGERLLYWRGYLPRDREHNRDCDEIARMAMLAGTPKGFFSYFGRKTESGIGTCDLLQVRLGDFAYEYFLVGRRHQSESKFNEEPERNGRGKLPWSARVGDGFRERRREKTD